MSQLLYSPFPVAIRTAQHHLSVATASPPIWSRRPFPRCLLLKDAKKGTTAREDAEGSEKGTAAAAASVDEKYTQWKSPVPVLFDWLANNNLVWPFLSCRWGPQLEQATYKNRQRLYLSEQTDGSVSNTPVIANCEVVKPRVAVAAEHISQFNEDARSPFVKK